MIKDLTYFLRVMAGCYYDDGGDGDVGDGDYDRCS